MIPSVQLVSNSGTLTNIHNDLLGKFELPIMPSSNSADQTTAHVTRFNGHFDGNGIIMHHNEVLIRTMKTDDFGEIVLDCVTDHNVDDVNDVHNKHAICIDSDNMVNYTIIGNGLFLNVIDESEMEFDDCTNDSSNVNERESDDAVDAIIQPEIIDEEHSDRLYERSNRQQSNDKYNNEHNLCAEIENVHGKLSITAVESADSSCAPDVIESSQKELDENDDDDIDDSSSEHELTNLGWLIDLKNLAHFPSDAHASKRDSAAKSGSHALPTSAISTCIINDIDDDNGRVEPIVSDKDLSEERFKKFTVQVKQ